MGFKFWLIAAGMVFLLFGSGVIVFGAISSLRRSAAEVPAPAPASPPGLSQAPSGADDSGRVTQVIGVLLLGGGMYYFWRRQRSLYESIKAREGPTLNNRIRSAVAKLNTVDDSGVRVIDERVRGIDELGRLVEESPRDYWPVMEVLSRYVRQNAPVGDAAGDENATLGPDVLMALTVISARPHSGRGGDRLDLSHTDLRGVQLPGAHLEGVDLSSSRLDGATLVNACLHLANLTDTNLSGADLRGAEGLSRNQLNSAITTALTHLPADLLSQEDA